MTLAEAITRLARVVAASEEPVIEPAELQAILEETAFAETRANSTAYSVGDKVVPATRNGRIYECYVAGTSGSSAPDWPDTGGIGDRVSDGTTLVWVDIGNAHDYLYDLNAAAKECWIRRAARVSSAVTVSDGGASVDTGSLQAHCLRMAAKYDPLSVW